MIGVYLYDIFGASAGNKSSHPSKKGARNKPVIKSLCYRIAPSDSIFYMEDIFHQHIKVHWYSQHKFGRWSTVPTFYPADSFGAVSDSSGKVILVNATLLSDFSDIIGNRHKNPFFQFYRYFLIVIMQNNVSDKKDLQFYRQSWKQNGNSECLMYS